MARIIIKIGTNALTNEEGKVSSDYIKNLSSQVSSLIEKKNQVVLVSSGAIGAGSIEMGFKDKIRDMPTKQAMAAIGQSLVMNEYHSAFAKHNIKVAQILITYDDFSNRTRYLNLKNTLEKLLKMGVVPILNENDPISINEIGESFGDNDKLSALVSTKLDANMLIILSDIEGLFDEDPKKNKDAKLISEVEEITPEIENMCGKRGSVFSVGGMESKINAVNIATTSGVSVVICDASEKNVVTRIVSGEKIGTLFKPHKTLNQKKQWIKEAKSIGTIYIDDGASNALKSGRNLLPAGITKVDGNFDCEAIIDVVSSKGLFAKAVVDFSSDALLTMLGKKSSEINNNGSANVIKRENLVIL